jgi:rubrerythrin
MDKIGERIAFERAGTRLYEALITKYEGVQALGQEALIPADQLPPAEGVATAPGSVPGESPMQTLMRIRSEELEHFRMLGLAMQKMGGDPTAQTPCADVTATASLGIVQVVTDPRTTLAQCLNAMLTAELTDNAGWELLVQLAEDAGETELAGRFLGALGQEQEHLAIVKGWLTALVTQGAGTPAV